ncbi:alpha/beta fold hydrolase [Catenulispora rubra]|uniref:alpha/beta fold hydrolase n=1 Tax=Catenulispora rubra TaxID=280293 RepID=UPI0018924348|nr:alpha/beta fold hydrolase [Catenulispora rubra]
METDQGVPVRRGYVGVPTGQIHFAQAGTGTPVLMLHQTPRSWTEFQYVLPLLGRDRRAIAMDTLGYGASSPPDVGDGPDTVEAYADGVIRLLDALGIDRAALVGHHTGGIIAVEVAAAHPERVTGVVLSCTPLVDEQGRRNRPEVDGAPVAADGSHLTELWGARRPYYPAGRPDLLEDYIADALRCGPRRAEGHRAVARFEMERRIPLLRCPVLLLGAPGDIAYQDLPRWSAALPEARTTVIDGGLVPLPDHLPAEFTAAVRIFLDEL